MARVTCGTAELELSFEAELPGEAGEKVEAGSARSWGADAEQPLSISFSRPGARPRPPLFTCSHGPHDPSTVSSFVGFPVAAPARLRRFAHRLAPILGADISPACSAKADGSPMNRFG